MKMNLCVLNKLGLAIILICFLSCSSNDGTNGVTKIEKEETQQEDSANPIDVVDNNTGDWNLVFEENFDSNLDKWNVWLGGAFNNEIQLYNQQQLNVQNGVLTINAEKKTVSGATSPFDPAVKEFQYVSGRLETKEQFGPSNTEGEMEYRIVSRIKLPSGNGMWPAFWTYADPWPTKGEIDILEARGNQTSRFQSNIFYGTQVNIPLTKNEETSKSHLINLNITSNFHVYELIWKANTLEILFDGQLLHTYNADAKNFVAQLFGNKHQIVLNLAVGGGFFEGVNTSGFVNSASMQVDWVKVYRK